MRLLVTGASGYLGRRLARRAARGHTLYAGYAHHAERVPAGEPIHFDLERPTDAVARIRDLRPEAILHTAALNPGQPVERMMAVNRDGSRAVAEAAASIGARLVHVSTDVVHRGDAAPYRDDAPAAPLEQLYPLSKAAGESAVLATLPRAVAVRTSLIYDLDEIDAGTRSFRDRLERGEPVRLFADVLRQPIWAETLAEALLRLAESEVAGPLNVAGEEALSRDAFGRAMLGYWGVNVDEAVEEGLLKAVDSRDLGVEVPRDLRLCMGNARAALGMELPGVSAVLAANRSKNPMNG